MPESLENHSSLVHLFYLPHPKMQNILEIGLIEQEFEDLQGLIRQHFNSIQELDSIRSQIHSLQEFQKISQARGQNTTEFLHQVKTAQQQLDERTNAFEVRLKKLGNQLAKMQAILSQETGKAESWVKQKDSIMVQAIELEGKISLLMQDIERLDKVNEAVEKRFLDLEVRLNMHYRLLQQLSEKTKTLYRGMFLWGLLGFAILFFILRR